MKLIGIKKKMWNTLRQSALIRDRFKCVLCGSTSSLQVDHCFSRNNTELFFELKNLSVLCASCHTKKTYHIDGYEKLVDEWVRKREGESWWKWAHKTVKRKKPMKLDPVWLESKFAYLQDELEKAKMNFGVYE